MSKILLKRIAVISVLLVTTVLFIRYYQAHPEYLELLKTVSPWVIVIVLLLNVLMTFTLTLLNLVSAKACNVPVGRKEMFMLTSYSSLANFFGPLQSGPGVRAAYLKSRYGLRLRDYTFVTLIMMAIFALWNVVFLLGGMRPWWQTLLGIVSVLGCCALVFKWFNRRKPEASNTGKLRVQITPRIIVSLVLLTLLQVLIIAAWYFVELRAVDPQISVRQALSYTGAANFSLFVSFTPDGVGIREAFLVFSQHIHQVPTKDIISANIIDRAVYVAYLLGLFGLTLLMHAKDRLQLATLNRSAKETKLD